MNGHFASKEWTVRLSIHQDSLPVLDQKDCPNELVGMAHDVRPLDPELLVGRGPIEVYQRGDRYMVRVIVEAPTSSAAKARAIHAYQGLEEDEDFMDMDILVTSHPLQTRRNRSK